MTKEATKERVFNKLVKGGYNVEAVKDLMKEFDYAYNTYRTPAKVAECLTYIG